MPESSPEYRCEFCGTPLRPSEHYVVRIDVFADPELPQMTAEQIAGLDFDAALQQVIDEAGQMTEQQLKDAVHQRFEYRLCVRCRNDFITNPLGRPRRRRIATN